MMSLSLLLALALGGAPATAELPRVHLLATGGTISGGSGGSLSAEGLVELLPGLASVARVSLEDYSRIGSSRMTPELQYGLAQRINALYTSDDPPDGIVVTHGTDSLEETAFLLDLLVPAGRPVVFAAAQRPPRETDTDGPRNLLNAFRVAANPAFRELGVMVTLNDEVHAARDVRKTHSIAVNAFVSPWVGPMGYVDGEQVYLFNRPARRLELHASRVEPRVSLITLVAGSDGSLIRAAVASGAKGIVVEVFGRGNSPPQVMEAVKEAIARDVVVVFSTRTGGGRVELGGGAREAGVLSAEDLDGLKARIVLVVGLGVTQNRETLASYFRALSGLREN